MASDPFRKKRVSWLTLMVFFILVAGFFAGLILTSTSREFRSKATNSGPTLSLLPRAASLTVGETATLGINVNTNGDTVTAAQLHLTYDPNAIQIVSFTQNGETLPVVLKKAAYGNGAFTVTLGVSPNKALAQPAVIGSLQIKLLTNKQSQISFAADTIVTSIGNDTNRLAGTTGTTVSALGATPTQTPTPTRRPTSSPIPTPTPTGTPPLTGDFTGDEKINIIDFTLYMSYWFLNDPKADLNGDGRKSVIDYTIFMNAWYASH